MDANTLARVENEYSKLTDSINKLGDYLLKQMDKKKTLTDNHYKLLIKQYAIMQQYADVLAQRINLARKEK
jgi:hypothetical protein